MSLGSLVVELSANIARFESEMQRAVGIGEGAMKRIESAAGIAKTALGAIGVGASIGGFAAWIKGAIDLQASLDDLSEQTTLSVELLDRLQQVSKIAGTSVEELAGIASKFAKNAAEAAANPKGNLAKLFDDVGVKAEDAAKNVDDALVKVIRAITNAEDKPRALAIALGLMGRGAAEAMPKLNDIADLLETRIARTTADQAKTAEALGREWGRIRVEADNLALTIARGLTPAMMDALKRTNELIRDYGLLAGATLGLAEAYAKLWANMFFGAGIPASNAQRADDALERQRRLVQNLKQDIAGVDSPERSVVGRAMDKVLGRTADDLKRQLQVEELTLAQMESAKKLREAAAQPQTPPPGVPLGNTGLVDATKKDKKPKAIDIDKETMKDAPRVQPIFADADYQPPEVERLRKYVDQLRDAVDPAERLRKELADIDQIMSAPEVYGASQFDAMLLALNAQSRYDAAISQTVSNTNKATDAWRDFGFVAESALERAIASGEKLGSVVRGLGQDVARLLTREFVTKPLGEAFLGRDDGKGGRTGGLMAPLQSGLSSLWDKLLGMVPKFAGGTPYVEADGLAYLHRGEAVVTAADNARGWQGVTVQQTINVSTGVAATVRSEMLALLPAFQDSAVAAVADARARGAL